jgi:hypothetical protein
MKVSLAFLVLVCTVLAADAQVLTAVPPVAGESLDNELDSRSPEIGQSIQEHPASGTDRVPAGNPLWGIPLKGLTATRERPIFSPSRRPPPPAPIGPIAALGNNAGAKREPDRPQLKLVGTVIGEKESIGVFLNQTTKDAIRLKPGEKHEGWTLESVHGREATFQKNQQTVVLTLPPPGSEQSAAIPPPAEQPVPPAGRQVSPAGRQVLPAGRQMQPAELMRRVH